MLAVVTLSVNSSVKGFSDNYLSFLGIYVNIVSGFTRSDIRVVLKTLYFMLIVSYLSLENPRCTLYLLLKIPLTVHTCTC